MASPKTKATIYDVAARAGVAISTVSRVLNNSSDVSEPTRHRVLRAIDELQFRPDRTAKTLAQKQAKSICVALPSFTTPFHNELLKGVRSALRDSDLDLLLCDLGSTSPRRTLLDFLKRGAVDGLVLAGMPVNEDLAAELEALRAPVILIGHTWPTFDSFQWNDALGSRRAMEHLIGLGHRRIAFISTSAVSPLQQERQQGYRQALEAAGITYDPALVRSGSTEKHSGFSEEAGYEAMRGLLDERANITAVFAASDVQAIGAYMALSEADLRIPRDVSLCGYDDVKMSRFIGLTSIDQHIHEIGERASQLLLRRVEGDRSETIHVVDDPELRIRKTTGPAPRS